MHARAMAQAPLNAAFVLLPRFTLTAFAGFVDACGWLRTKAIAAGSGSAGGTSSASRPPRVAAPRDDPSPYD